MNDFTDAQITALKEMADARIAEDKEIADRNAAVDAHTASVEALNTQVLALAEQQGIDPTTFQVAPSVTESSDEMQNFQAFQDQVSQLAKQQGLDTFEVRKVQ